jgi:hypothetical protein
MRDKDGMINKLSLGLFVPIVFLVTAVLDATTTYAALRWFDGIELNKYTDTSSFFSIIIYEFVGFSILLIVCVITNYSMQPRAYDLARSYEFNEFEYRIMRSRLAIPWCVMLLAFAVGLIRIVVIVGNISFIAIGASPLDKIADMLSDAFGISKSAALATCYGIIAACSAHSISHILYSRLRKIV